VSVLSISGPIGRTDVPTTDGRLLVGEGLVLPERAIPLTALHAGIRPDLGDYGADPVGVISTWDTIKELELPGSGRPHSNVLEVLGEVYDDQRVPASTYRGGLQVSYESADVEVRPDERWPEQGLFVIRRWTPIAVVLHLPGSLGVNAWPDLADLVVEVPKP